MGEGIEGLDEVSRSMSLDEEEDGIGEQKWRDNQVRLVGVSNARSSNNLRLQATQDKSRTRDKKNINSQSGHKPRDHSSESRLSTYSRHTSFSLNSELPAHQSVGGGTNSSKPNKNIKTGNILISSDKRK